MWKKCREIKILLPWTRHNQPGVQDPSSLLSPSSRLSERRSSHLYYPPYWNHRTHGTAGFFWTVLQGLVCPLPSSPQLLGTALPAPAKLRSKGSWRPSSFLCTGPHLLVLLLHGCCGSVLISVLSPVRRGLFEWKSLNHKWFLKMPDDVPDLYTGYPTLSLYLLSGMGCSSCK